MNKAVFLDRDGTIIIDKVYLNDPNQIEYLPGAIEGLKEMRDMGFELIVVTNQSGVARGIVQLENIHEIHRRISEYLSSHDISISGYYFAPYSVESNHPMRKPNPGMLLAGAHDFNINLSQCWMIGDRLTDVEAGRRAGAQSILLGTGTKDPDHGSILPPAHFAADLVECAQIIKAHV